MNRNNRFTIVTIISFFSLLLVGVYTAHAAEALTRGGTQTAVSVDPVLQRGSVTPIPHRMDATQGPTDGHLGGTRHAQPPGQTRTGTQSLSSFPGPFKDLQAAIKVQPQNQVNAVSKTPCGSPKCLGEALTTQKPFTSQLDGISKGSGNVGSSKVMGTAGRGRR